MIVTLRHYRSKQLKKVKVGFSWTMLFFGGWVPLARGDFKHLFLHGLFLVFTLGLSELVYPFVYNRLYIFDQLHNGWWPATDRDFNELQRRGFVN